MANNALVKIQMKRASSSDWNRTTDTGSAWNGYLLRQAEFGIEVFPDNSIKIKIGDGSTIWKDLKYITGETGYFLSSLPDVSEAAVKTFYVVKDKLYYTVDNKNWILVGGDAQDFDKLMNRPKYNGYEMTHNTNIPKVPTAAKEISYKPKSGTNVISTNVQGALDELSTRVKNSIVPTNQSNILYGTDSSANVAYYPFSEQKINGSIAKRTSYGSLKTAEPVDLDDATTKKYVDDIKETLQNGINSNKNTLTNTINRVSTLETKTDDINTHIVNINNEISSINTQVTTNKTDITALKARVNTNESNINKNTNNISALNTKVNAFDTRITKNETDIQDEMTTRFNNDIKDISMTGTNGNTITLTKNDGSTLATNIPMASQNINGLMTKESYKKILENAEAIEDLKNQGGRYIGVSFGTKAELDNFTITDDIKVGDFTYVSKDETHNKATALYICTMNGSSKQFNFAYVIEHEAIGIATTTYKGLVLSDTKDGKIFVETDGTMSLNGYDNIISKFNDKVDKVDGKGLSTNDFTNAYKNKIDIITTTGDGSLFLTDDGTYKQIVIPKTGVQDIKVNDSTIVDDLGSAHLHVVSTTGSYNDLKDKPQNLVQDADYVHTDNNFKNTYKLILESISTMGSGNAALMDDMTYKELADIAFTGNWVDLQGKPTDLVQDVNYVHTDNNFTTALRDKLISMNADGEANIIESVSVNNMPLDIDSKNVNIDLTPYALAANIPTKLSQLTNDNNTVTDANYVHTDNNFTTALKTKLDGIETSADVNKIEVVKVDGMPLMINSSDKSVNIALAGFAAASDLEELTNTVATNKTNIQALQNGGLWRGYFDTYASLPTKTPNASFIGGIVDANDYVIIKEDENVLDESGNPCKTRYYATAIDESGNITWTYFDKEEGSIAIATNTSLGTVMGTTDSDTTKGKISVELDGTMSLNGYDELVSKFDEYIPMSGTTNSNPITGMLTFANNVGGIEGRIGSNDIYRIVGRSTATDAGYLEIATCDNGDEPIYVRQYADVANKFENIKNQVTLMDATGSTILAGHLYLPGVADATYDSKSNIIFGDTTTQYACIRTNKNKSIVFADSISDNSKALAYVPAEDHFGPATDAALSLGTKGRRYWNEIRGVRLFGGNGTASHIIIGGGNNNHVWIDNRDREETTVRSNIWLNDNGIVSLPKGKLGLYTDAPENDKAVMQYNIDENAIEFVFA